MKDEKVTPEELARVEQAKSDPLYIALMLRHRVNNAKAKLDHFNSTRPANRQIYEPEFVGLSVNEAEIMLKHFSAQAEKMIELSGRLEATRKQGEVWMRDAKHANDLLGRAMLAFKVDGWRVEKQEDQGWMVHSPRASGVASHTVVFEDDAHPAEALLAILLDAIIEDGKAGFESNALADALEYLGKHGGDAEA